MKNNWKKNKLLLPILGILVLLIYGNCYQIKLPEPKNIKLPAETTSGKNTFGCVIDGENFKNKSYWQVILVIPSKVRGVSSSFYEPDSINFQSDYSFQVTGNMVYIKKDQSMNLFVTSDQPFEMGKTYDLAKNKGGAYFYDSNSGTNFSSNESDFFELTFTRFDTKAGIASGRFSGKLVSENSEVPEIIDVKDGRFDVKYNKN
jgi:hypothetical protein